MSKFPFAVFNLFPILCDCREGFHHRHREVQLRGRNATSHWRSSVKEGSHSIYTGLIGSRNCVSVLKDGISRRENCQTTRQEIGASSGRVPTENDSFATNRKSRAQMPHHNAEHSAEPAHCGQHYHVKDLQLPNGAHPGIMGVFLARNNSTVR